MLDNLFEDGKHARVVGGDAALESVDPLVEAEGIEILIGQGPRHFEDDLSDSRLIISTHESQARSQALADGVVTALAAEEEVDGR